MKILITICTALFISITAYTQDTTLTARGYTLDFPHLYCRVDTLNKVNQIVSYYRGKHYFSVKVNGAYIYKNVALTYGSPLTIQCIHSDIIVIKRRYRRVYKV